jgi:acyl-CoA-binding protein
MLKAWRGLGHSLLVVVGPDNVKTSPLVKTGGGFTSTVIMLYALFSAATLAFAAHTLLLRRRRAPSVTVGQPVSSPSSPAFTTAQEAVNHAPAGFLSDTDRLRLYGLYKQACVGPNTTKPPTMLDVVGSAKWCAVRSSSSIMPAVPRGRGKQGSGSVVWGCRPKPTTGP